MLLSKEEKQDIDRILDIKQSELWSSAGACSDYFPNNLLEFTLAHLNYSKYLTPAEKRVNEGYMKNSLIKFHDRCKIVPK